jgi:hypothetical protein
MTDRRSGATTTDTGTVQQLSLPVDMPCSVTLDPTIGSTCAVTTTLDAITPEMVDEGSRGAWEMGLVDVLDGGADGNVQTEPNGVFMRQGIFVP